jgi:hypothetical protein
MQVRAADPSDIDLPARVWYDGSQDAQADILPLDQAARRTLGSFRQRSAPSTDTSAGSRAQVD